MYSLTPVEALPARRAFTVKDYEIVDMLYEFIVSESEISRVEDYSNYHMNGNNLRRTIQSAIVREKLQMDVDVTIRGNTVYLIRRKRK